MLLDQRRRRTKKLLGVAAIAVALASCAPAPAAAADVCADILREGRFDSTFVRNDITSLSRFLDFYSRTQWSNREVVNVRKTELGGNYDVFGAEYGEETSTSEIDQSFEDLIILNERQFFLSDRTTRNARIASATIVNAWESCMSRNGLKVSKRYSLNPDEILIVLSFASDGSNNPIVRRISTGSDAASCDVDPMMPVTPGRKHEIRCSRSIDVPVTIIVDVDRAVTFGDTIVDWPVQARPRVITAYLLRVTEGRGPLVSLSASPTSSVDDRSIVLSLSGGIPPKGREIDVTPVFSSLSSLEDPIHLEGLEDVQSPDRGSWFIAYEIVAVDDLGNEQVLYGNTMGYSVGIRRQLWRLTDRPPRWTATPTSSRTATPTSTSSRAPTATTPATAIPSPTASRTPSPIIEPETECVGDCDGTGAVTVDEIVTMVVAALEGGIGGCLAGDSNLDGGITVDEIIDAISNALKGCSR